LPWNKLRARTRDKRPSIHLNISDIQYACSNTHHKDVTNIVFIGPQYARARADGCVADRCRTFPLGALRIFHARGRICRRITTINGPPEFSRFGSVPIRQISGIAAKLATLSAASVPNLQFRLQRY